MPNLLKTGKIPCWWPAGPNPGNFGDILTPLLIKGLFGYDVRRINPPFGRPVLLGVGSIVNKAESSSVIWGSGVIRETDPIKQDAIFLCVRGVHTHALVTSRGVSCPTIFGDPALIMPHIYKPNVTKRFSVGIFPHYVDYEKVSLWYSNDSRVKVINPLSHNPYSVIDQVLQCDNIISSSLHGLIIAHAYNRPTVWVKHSDKLGGDGIKFHDHLDLVGIPAVHMDFYEKLPVEDLLKFDYKHAYVPDMRPVIKVLDTYLHEK